MTYVIATTVSEGKSWAASYLPKVEKYKVLSTWNSIVGRIYTHHDSVYILTTDNHIMKALIPGLVGCQVFSCNEWILKK